MKKQGNQRKTICCDPNKELQEALDRNIVVRVKCWCEMLFSLSGVN